MEKVLAFLPEIGFQVMEKIAQRFLGFKICAEEVETVLFNRFHPFVYPPPVDAAVEFVDVFVAELGSHDLADSFGTVGVGADQYKGLFFVGDDLGERMEETVDVESAHLVIESDLVAAFDDTVRFPLIGSADVDDGIAFFSFLFELSGGEGFKRSEI